MMAAKMRHREVSRLEGFSDAVFGFALTLLVVSLDTPTSFEALRDQVAGFVPFALTFAMVCWIWYEHNIFFRRYGLQGPWTVFLNCVLLFVVLFYVYPLRFLTQALVGPLVGLPEIDIRAVDGAALMALYSSGVLVIFSVFVLLHWHAWKQRAVIGLDALEELQLKHATRGHMLSAAIAVASLLLVAALPHQSMWSGVVYSLMGPVHAWNGYQGGRASERLRRQASAPAEQLQRGHEADDQPAGKNRDL